MLDVAGSRPFRQVQRVLTPDATTVIVGGPMNKRLGPLPHVGATWLSTKLRRRTVKFFVARIEKDDLELLREQLASGKVKPVVDRTYDLSRVPDALRYLGEGHVRGKLVITAV